MREAAPLWPWLGAMLAALLVQHFVIHRGIILPAGPDATPPWAWAALFAPELIVCFAAGWRLRSWSSGAAFAVLATAVRQVFFALLHLAGEAGHETVSAPRVESALAAPLVAAAYLLVVSVAAASARREPDADAGIGADRV